METERGPGLLKGFREKRKLTRRQVAKRLDTSTVSVNQWESGEATPGPLARKKIAKWTLETDPTTGERRPKVPESAWEEPGDEAALRNVIPYEEEHLEAS